MSEYNTCRKAVISSLRRLGVLLVLLDERPEVSLMPSPGDVNAVHLENVPPEGARLDEAALTQGTRVGLLARVGHSVLSVVKEEFITKYLQIVIRLG